MVCEGKWSSYCARMMGASVQKETTIHRKYAKYHLLYPLIIRCSLNFWRMMWIFLYSWLCIGTSFFCKIIGIRAFSMFLYAGLSKSCTSFVYWQEFFLKWYSIMPVLDFRFSFSDVSYCLLYVWLQLTHCPVSEILNPGCIDVHDLASMNYNFSVLLLTLTILADRTIWHAHFWCTNESLSICLLGEAVKYQRAVEG